MALYAISDLHLSFGTDKPMHIFGKQWEDYEQRLRVHWNQLVMPDDVVIINGDLSWATYIEDAEEDFSFLAKLPGIKYISKGNHDYWWTTAKKQQEFLDSHGFTGIRFLHNNYFMYEGTAFCGTRGWQAGGSAAEDEKLFNRESQRLRLSIEMALKENPEEIIAVLHYPPAPCFTAIMKEYDIRDCLYGHLHGVPPGSLDGEETDGIRCRLVACDYLRFVPLRIK